MLRVKWTAELDNELIRLIATRQSSKEIARVIGTSDGAIRKRAIHLRVSIPRPRRPVYLHLVLKFLSSRGDLTASALAELLRVKPNNINKILKQGMPDQLHINRYERNHKNQPVAVYRVGSGKNAKKPKPLDHRQRTKRYVERLKKEDPDKFESQKERKLARRRVPKPDKAAQWIKPQGSPDTNGQ